MKRTGRASADAIAAAGRHHLKSRQLPAAAQCFRRAIELLPGAALLHAELGQTLRLQGREFDALEEYQRALAGGVDPAQLPVVAQLLFDQGEWRRGAEQLEQAALRDADTLSGHLTLANRLMMEGAHDAAMICAGKTVSQYPQSAGAQCILGFLLVQQGDFDKAADHFEAALAIDPRNTRAYQGLVATRRISQHDKARIAELENLAQNPSLCDEDRATAHYALGQVKEDSGDHADAAEHFEAANRINRKLLVLGRRALDHVRHAATIDQLIALFTPEFFAGHKSFGSDSERPVFIVGMIRSGTTLVEQIISRHKQISPGGERKFWSRRAFLHGLLQEGGFDDAGAAQTRLAYEKLLGSISATAPRVTDKMPGNFLLLGLICLLFPRAKIIHCLRDPRDTCVSIFTTAFGNLPDFAHDWKTIVFYYQQYARLMRHWKTVLPAGSLLDVSYEKLVTQRETTTRDLMAFCGVGWDPACLEPQRNARIIATPSNWQARQPVTDKSVGRWRHYAAWQKHLDGFAGSMEISR